MDWNLELLMIARALAAAGLGALIGFQRERSGQEAGIRTFATVAIGSCVFGLMALIPGIEASTRIPAQVVSGVGFICTGVVLHSRGHVRGITTAASIWATAAIGLLSAYGMLLVGVALTLCIFGLLSLPPKAGMPRENRRPNAGPAPGAP